MNTIAFYNLKGGVGKTAAAVNIAYLAARAGVPTLLWDLDGQGAASWILRTAATAAVKPKKLLNGKAPLGHLVCTSPWPRLDVIPAMDGFHDLDPLLARADDPDRLAALLRPFGETYGLVVLDCPPSLSQLAANVFRAADAVLVPMIPSPLSLLAFTQITKQFEQDRLPRERLLPFYSLVDRRRRQHQEWLLSAPAALDGLLPVAIPYAASVERMSEVRAPLPAFAPQTSACEAYVALAEAIRRHFVAGRARKLRSTGRQRPETA